MFPTITLPSTENMSKNRVPPASYQSPASIVICWCLNQAGLVEYNVLQMTLQAIT